MHWAVEVEFLPASSVGVLFQCLHDRLPCSWGLVPPSKERLWVGWDSPPRAAVLGSQAQHIPPWRSDKNVNSAQACQGPSPSQASWESLYLLCKNFLRHKILEGLMVPLGPDSSPSPNSCLRNTASSFLSIQPRF